MKKRGKSRQNGKTQAVRNRPGNANLTQVDKSTSASRRGFLRHLRNAAIALPVLGGGAYYSISTIQASIREADLSRIGNGKPAIVQIHDPQCNLCRNLQSQTRSALGRYKSQTFEYLVANIKTKSGGELALRHGVSHVTLLLFDPEGKLVQVVRGPLSDVSLKGFIAVHMQRFAKTA